MSCTATAMHPVKPKPWLSQVSNLDSGLGNVKIQDVTLSPTRKKGPDTFSYPPVKLNLRSQ